MTQQEAIELLKNGIENIITAAKILNLGDPFSYNRIREIQTAIFLGHKVSMTYEGADGFNWSGEPAEYKSTIQKEINATYNGISVKPSWEEQLKYLIEEKIGKYPEHYFARFEDGRIVELYVASKDSVLELLLPKLRKKYFNLRKKDLADPRLGANLSKNQIKKISWKLV